MNERRARRQWNDPTAEIAIRRSEQSYKVNGTSDLSKLDDQISELETRLKTSGSKARNRKLRNLRRLRNRLIWEN